MSLEFCLAKELCISNTWFKRGAEGNVPFGLIVKEAENDCVDEHRAFVVFTKCNNNGYF